MDFKGSGQITRRQLSTPIAQQAPMIEWFPSWGEAGARSQEVAKRIPGLRTRMCWSTASRPQSQQDSERKTNMAASPLGLVARVERGMGDKHATSIGR